MLLFVLHVEANLNSQGQNNAHLTTIVSFLKRDFFLGHTVYIGGTACPLEGGGSETQCNAISILVYMRPCCEVILLYPPNGGSAADNICYPSWSRSKSK